MRTARPTLTLVVAVLALALSVGGVSYAAGKINTRDIKNGAVTTPKIKNNAVKGKKVRNNSLTGADIKEATLKRVGRGETVTIAGIEFTPRDSEDERTSPGAGQTYRTAAGNSWFGAPVHLPHGSVVKDVKFYLLDNTAAGSIAVSFARYEISTGALIDVRFQDPATVDTPAIVEVDNTPELSRKLIVDNRKYAYYVLAKPGAASPNLAIYGAKVRYSLLPTDLAAAKAAPARAGVRRSLG